MVARQVNFWTPLRFPEGASVGDRLLELSGRYLYLGGEIAAVQKRGRKALLKKESCSFWTTLFKVISYITLILPLIALLVKLRAHYASPVFLYHERSLGVLERGKGAIDAAPAGERGEFFASDEVGNTPLHTLMIEWERADQGAIKQLLISGTPEQIFAPNNAGKTALNELFCPHESGLETRDELLTWLDQNVGDQTLSILQLFLLKARPIDLIASFSDPAEKIPFSSPLHYFCYLGIPALLDTLFEKLEQLSQQELEEGRVSWGIAFHDLIVPPMEGHFPLAQKPITLKEGCDYALRLLNLLPPSKVSEIDLFYVLIVPKTYLTEFIDKLSPLSHALALALTQKVDRSHFFQRIQGREPPFVRAVFQQNEGLLRAMIDRFSDDFYRGAIPQAITDLFPQWARFPEGAIYRLEQMVEERKKELQKLQRLAVFTSLVEPSEASPAEAPLEVPAIRRSFVQYHQFERHLLPLILQYL